MFYFYNLLLSWSLPSCSLEREARRLRHPDSPILVRLRVCTCVPPAPDAKGLSLTLHAPSSPPSLSIHFYLVCMCVALGGAVPSASPGGFVLCTSLMRKTHRCALVPDSLWARAAFPGCFPPRFRPVRTLFLSPSSVWILRDMSRGGGVFLLPELGPHRRAMTWR